ncbi:hypothetical protein CWB96_06295 [Pseudoalteromonas citrea]|uniref:Uncharacterized protein n=2 Tax=Pseudoalteromonas citrea TaxID=43655 RepID=A0A5S3XRQ5_9GAMM|nr:hypothetical protein [Pseudoalteromonas citrea]TMP60575.1 hypothetical protein CWB96_06295 [Pseudoalteromonas citrea]
MLQHDEKLKKIIDTHDNNRHEKVKNRIKTSGNNFVHFPPSARGDMNSYKYVSLLTKNERPITVFEYHQQKGKKALGKQQQGENRNISIINDHIESIDRFEEDDYTFASTKDMNTMKGLAGKRVAHYQQYDHITTVPYVRGRAKQLFRDTATKEPQNSYLNTLRSKKGLELSGERSSKEGGLPLLLFNINKRAVKADEKWNPREMRHQTGIDELFEMIGEIYKKNKDSLVGFVGSKITDINVAGLSTNKIINLTDMVEKSISRLGQRAVQNIVTGSFKNTAYIGMQSGVNEDASTLPRTNVYSISEYLAEGQVGIKRVEARTQLDSGHSRVGNFYSVRKNDLLTTEGILAAIQLKIDDKTEDHLGLKGLMGKISQEVEVEKKAESLLDEISISVGKGADYWQNLGGGEYAVRSKNTFLEAAKEVIVRELGMKSSKLSPETKEFLNTIMFDDDVALSHEALHTQRKRLLNSGIQPYPVGEQKGKLKRLEF